MTTLIVSGLVLFAFAALGIAFRISHTQQQRQIEELIRQRKRIQSEEYEVFDFLHSLGEAFSEDIRSSQLHRLIVDGAVRILEAHGGALYLKDRTSSRLVPNFTSPGCPPLIRIPTHIQLQAESSPIAVESYVRLHAIEPGEGVIGRVWASKVARKLILEGEGGDELGELQGNKTHVYSALIAPLNYAGNWMGILAVVNGPMGSAFTEASLNIFLSLAEQAAFALFNASIHLEASEKRKIDSDLQIARDIQRILLPARAPEVPGFEVHGINLPARYVSGDYYDYIKINDSTYGIVIADVSGKGIPASLIMVMCRSVLRSQAIGNTSASGVLKEVNRQLFPDIKEDMFISMAYLILDTEKQTITLSRAGHDPPLLYIAKEKAVKKITPPGMAVGIDMGVVFDRINTDFYVTLERDDCIVLYTDGITESVNHIGIEYGTAKMIQTIQQVAHKGAPAIIEHLTQDVVQFVGNQPQHDDITLIAIRKL